jgi:hypothetical protein
VKKTKTSRARNCVQLTATCRAMTSYELSNLIATGHNPSTTQSFVPKTPTDTIKTFSSHDTSPTSTLPGSSSSATPIPISTATLLNDTVRIDSLQSLPCNSRIQQTKFRNLSPNFHLSRCYTNAIDFTRVDSMLKVRESSKDHQQIAKSMHPQRNIRNHLSSISS